MDSSNKVYILHFKNNQDNSNTILFVKKVEEATQLEPVIENENETDRSCESLSSKSFSIRGN